jgi:tetratricopeptide (TPR) repeat protein
VASAPSDPGFEVIGEAPAPPGAPTQVVDPFANSPVPAASADLGFDLPSSPVPPAPFSSTPTMAFGEPVVPGPAKPAAPGLGFGEVDFGSPTPAPVAPPPASAAGDLDFGGFDSAPAAPVKKDDALEFDPLGPKPRSGADDLEADLGAPLPSTGVGPAPQAPGGSDLELLDFIDDASAGKDAGKRLRPGSQRYQIRRKSGKVFGPFEQPAVVKMLQEGQLLGNEDVTIDGEAWVPIGSVQAFAEAIQKLMESPGGLPGLAAGPLPEEGAAAQSATPDAAAALERMKALYGDRMAAIAVVDSAAAEEKFKKRLPLIILGALVLIVLGVGLYMGTTAYGFFGMKYLAPSHLSKGSADWTKFQEAQKAILEDNYESYTRALADSQSLLKSKEAVESRALFVQIVFYLKRRYYTGDEHLAKARQYLDELNLGSSKNDPESIKARAGYHLLKSEEAQIRPALEAAINKNKDDVELLCLLAESHLRERATGPATEALKRALALDGKSAKVYHLLAYVKTLEKTPDYTAALDFYGRALEADPRHLASAVELAAINLQKLDEPEKAADALRKATSDDGKKLLSPSDQARAHYLMGMLYAARHQREDAVKEFELALTIYPDSAPARAAYGRFLLRRHEYVKAVDLFDAAYKSDNKELDYLDGLTRSLLGAGKIGPAQKLMSDASANFPGSPRIAALQGRVSDEAEKGEDAEKSYKRAAQSDPKLWEPVVYLGNFYLRRKRPDEAKAAFADALVRAPNIPETHVGQGDYLLATGKVREAKEEYLAALKLDPEDPGGHFGFAQVLAAEGAMADARKEYEQVISIDPYVPQLYTQYGTLLWKVKELEAAAAALEKAKEADPKDAIATWRLGAVYFDLNKLNEALKNLGDALSIEPSNPDAYYYKAKVHYERRENNQAIESIKSALERSSTRPEFYNLKGAIMFQANKFSEAVESWQQAVKLKPDYADPLEALGHSYQDRGDWSNCIAAYERTMTVDPSRMKLVMNVAECLSGQSHLDAAIKKYEEALKVAPDDSKAAYFKIGRAYNDKGKIEQAIEYYIKATKYDPEAKEVYKYLGYAYKEKHKKALAVEAFEKYQKLVPEAPEKKEIENEIYDLKNEK